MNRSGTIGLLCCWLLAVSLYGPIHVASGQEVYELTNDGQWDKTETYDPTTPEGELQRIRSRLAEDDPGQALKLVQNWLEDYPSHPRVAEARLLQGDAKVARRDYYNALYDYEVVIREYPSSPLFHTALEREYEIAQLFASGVKRRFLGLEVLPAYGEAEEILIRIQERSPGSEIGERASLALADYYYDRGDMVSASEAYDLFLMNYPRSEYREKSMLRLIQANLARFQGPRHDPTGLIEASERLRVYQEEYPAAASDIDAEALQTRINHSMAAHDLATARWYDRNRTRVSAIYLFRRLIEDYPQSPAAREAINRLESMGENVSLPESQQ